MEELDLKHQSQIEHLLNRCQPVTSELGFASLFVWRKARKMFVLEVDDSIVLVTKKEKGLCVFGPPLGSLSIVDALTAVQELTDMPVVACERVPEYVATDIDPTKVELFEDRNNFDYVYRREDLSELAGRKYHNKRNLISQCLNKYDCTYESLSLNLIPEIKEMQKRWCAEKDCGKKPGLCHEHQAITELLNNAKELNILGGVIRIDGKVQAYTIASRLNEDTVDIHFEKAMTEYKGLYQLINQWFCINQLSSFEFVNREQDVGSEGIRKAKESYFPDHMIKKFVALHDISREEYERLKTKESHCE